MEKSAGGHRAWPDCCLLDTSPEELTAFEKYADVYAQNSDLVGWISIPGTRIDYPVMQTKDTPNFYLKHAFDKSYSSYGVPYMQENLSLIHI